MKAKILTDSNSLLTMFRLGAIEGELVSTNNFEKVFDKSIDDENLAILIVTRSVYQKILSKLIILGKIIPCLW